MKLTDLELAPSVAEACRATVSRRAGLTLICGPTGSGKTDTAEALVGVLSRNREVVRLSSIKNVSRPIDTWCVVDAGDLRGAEETSLAVDLALRTHVVGVLRSGFSYGALTRLIDMMIDPVKIRLTEPVVLTQQLCRRLCVHCRLPRPVADIELHALGLERDVLRMTHEYVYDHRGCDRCAQGFHGHVAIFEAIRPTIRESGEIVIKQLWSMLVHDGLLKAMCGATTLSELRDHYDPHSPGMVHPDTPIDSQ